VSAWIEWREIVPGRKWQGVVKLEGGEGYYALVYRCNNRRKPEQYAVFVNDINGNEGEELFWSDWVDHTPSEDNPHSAPETLEAAKDVAESWIANHYATTS
jgi:hypothetical protein